jgi:hypothetical protein
MSVDLDWSKFDEVIAEKVREFLNDRFQSLPLPSMLKSIEILSLEFGSVPPTIEIQHITDPYPEFYQDNYDEEDVQEELQRTPSSDPPEYSSQQYNEDVIVRGPSLTPERPRLRQTSSISSYVDAWAPPFFPQGVTVGGRPGNVFPPYFHPTPGIMSSGISTPTWMPGTSLARPPSRSLASASAVDAESVHTKSPVLSPDSSTIASFRPRSDTIDSTISPPPRRPAPPPMNDSFSRPTTAQSTIPEPLRIADTDIQVIARINYEGNPRAHIVAEVDLNYPSSSFISLPIRLTLTGVSFSGLALIASIGNRIHFCFLEDEESEDEEWEHMLREIHLESEIGERGKGVLKNVGKVERFLLEQGRRIITEEFVYPSFYTFIL